MLLVYDGRYGLLKPFTERMDDASTIGADGQVLMGVLWVFIVR